MSYCITISDKDANLSPKAQAGDTESVERLMRTHEGLVHHIVHQQWRGGLGYEETCRQRCRLTTPRDPAARLIHYTGSNQDRAEDPARARNVYGYRSYSQVLCDDGLHTYWVAYTPLHAATSDERVIMPNDFAHLPA